MMKVANVEEGVGCLWRADGHGGLGMYGWRCLFRTEKRQRSDDKQTKRVCVFMTSKDLLQKVFMKDRAHDHDI